jgi:16S rRNA (uracil1498-N3)-methyltransferase
MGSSGRTPRLCIPDALLSQKARVMVKEKSAHYLSHVMRLVPGSSLLVFNGRDGEWRACIENIERHSVSLLVMEQTRPQSAVPNIHYFFAPVRGERLDYIAQKAVEMGVRSLWPILTHHTQVRHLNLHKIHANMIEAAEQCGILTQPDVHPLIKLSDALVEITRQEGLLIFCDETAPLHSPLEALKPFRNSEYTERSISVLIGPEGGFSPTERTLIAQYPGTVRLSLGPRILRADTAGIAALSLIQSVLGDWR